MGVLSIIGRVPVPANGSNYSVLAFLAGLIFFVYFVKSKKKETKNDEDLRLCEILVMASTAKPEPTHNSTKANKNSVISTSIFL